MVLDVIHTVGPTEEILEVLASCYTSSLNLARKNNLTSIVRK